MTRLSRPCYDKPHRCPGWAGGGFKYAKGDSRCAYGYIVTRVPRPELGAGMCSPGEKPFRFGHCTECDVVTWPFIMRKLSIPWWMWRLRWKAQDARYRLSWWRR